MLENIDLYKRGIRMFAILSSTIKYFFIALGSIYGYTKILHFKPVKKEYYFAVLFSLLTSPLIGFVRETIPPFTIYTALFCIIIFCRQFTNAPSKNILLTLCIAMLSFGINYTLSTLSLLIAAPFFYYAFPHYLDTYFLKSVTYLFANILQIVFLVLIFQIPRLKKGIPDIEKNFSNEVGILISMPLLFISPLFSIKNKSSVLTMFAVFLTLTTGIIIFLWWHKYLLNNYIHKAQNQTIKILEDTIAEQKEELDKLSKIIHKDNKLIGALYLSVQELYANTRTEQSRDLQKELEILSEERKGILYHYENSGEHLPKTKVFSTDVIISYLFKRALEKDIHFDVAVSGDIRYMTEFVLEEALLNTLLADLGENAVIATAKAEHRNILLSLGIREKYYCIDFFDSGADFDARVIENLGQKRYSTHKSEGGSGIGLMTTLEILEKKKGSFELEEFQENCLFTKRVSIVLDRRCRIKVYSCRKDILAVCSRRGRDILLCPPSE